MWDRKREEKKEEEGRTSRRRRGGQDELLRPNRTSLPSSFSFSFSPICPTSGCTGPDGVDTAFIPSCTIGPFFGDGADFIPFVCEGGSGVDVDDEEDDADEDDGDEDGSDEREGTKATPGTTEGEGEGEGEGERRPLPLVVVLRRERVSGRTGSSRCT